jgi:hypothetical protein
MKLEKWALIAEIGSAIAVVVSLIFVGMQVRTGAEETAVNTAAIRAAAFQDLQTGIVNLNVLLIENPDFDAAVYRVLDLDQDPESEVQRRLAGAWLRLVIRHGEIAYKQLENGLIDESELRSLIPIVLDNLENREGRRAWRFLSPILDPGFVSYVEQLIEDLAVDQPEVQ